MDYGLIGEKLGHSLSKPIRIFIRRYKSRAKEQEKG